MKGSEELKSYSIAYIFLEVLKFKGKGGATDIRKICTAHRESNEESLSQHSTPKGKG